MGTLGSKRIDEDAIKSGIWETYEDIDLCLRPLYNQDHLDRAREIAAERGLHWFDGYGELDAETKVSHAEEYAKVLIEAMNGTVLVNWRNVEDEDENGEPLLDENGDPVFIAFSTESAAVIFTDRRYRDMVRFMELKAGNARRYREHALGNSRGSFRGCATETASDAA